jgi:hypothetical protein
MVKQVLLSQIGDPKAFAATLEAHRAALAAHRIGPTGIAAPQAHPLVDSLVQRVPATGPVATRGPDTFQIAPYEIVDDTPRSPEANKAISVLRETLGS